MSKSDFMKIREHKKLIIIGSGASSLFFTHLFYDEIKKIEDDKQKKDLISSILVIEAEEKSGKKILATGNGRCNILPFLYKKDNFLAKIKKF